MAVETVTIDVVINLKNNTASGLDSSKSKVDRFTQSVQKSKKEMDRLGGTTARPKVSLIDKASSTLSKIDSGLTKLGGKTVRAGVKIIDYATRPLRAIKNALFSIKGLVMAIGAWWAANKLISNPIGLADAYSSAKIGFSNLLGDAEGQAMMDKLDAFAKKTPFNTSGVISNAQMMMAMGWNPEDIIRDMETIGNAAAATGKGTQGLEAIVRALSQIKTKGKLSSEELNQLSEQGIAAKAMLAEQLGYGTGDSGIAKMSADLEKGLIGSDKAIQALLQGMKQFDGMMEKTANETVEGLKSQIQDAFEINIFRRWGQGLQDGAKRGFGKIVELLDKSEGTLEKFGDTVYEIGKELSNWAADKLENTIDKILEISNRDDFKNASLFGKAKILWDEIIAEPFSKWWNSKGKPFMAEKAKDFGETLGSGISNAIIGVSNTVLDLLGMDTIDTVGAESIGGSFAEGFSKGFQGKKVWEAITKAGGAALKSGFKTLFSGSSLTNIIATGLSIKVASGIVKGINWAQKFWSGTGDVTGSGGSTLAGIGLKGAIGTASSGTGLLGWGANTAINMGAGNLAGGASMSAGALSALGLGATAGGIAGGAGLINATVDLTRAVTAQTKNDTKLYGTRSATKFGMVGTGAAAGAAIGSIFGGVGAVPGALIGAGIGGISSFLAGNKLADAISGVSKSTKELNEEAAKLAKLDMAERFGDIELSAEQLAERVKTVFGAEQLGRINKFNQAMKDLQTISDSTMNYKNDVDYMSARITAGEKLSESDMEGYKNSLEGFTSSVANLLEGKKNSSISAFALLYGDDTKGLQKMTKSINSTYTKLEGELKEKTTSLNDTIAKAFEDGKIDIDEQKSIDELIAQIDKIYDQVEKHIEEKEKAKSDATYDLLGKKYKDTDLTADSFKTLLSELDKQGEANLKAYDDAYIEAKAELDIQYKGKTNNQGYKNKLAEIEKLWRDGKAITVKQKVNVAFDVLKTNYESEFAGLKKKLESDDIISTEQLSNLFNSTANYNYKTGGFDVEWGKGAVKEFEAMKNEFLESAGVDLTIQKEMAEFYESLKPQEEDLLALKESYEKAGEDIPKWIEDSLADIDNIKLMSGDMDSFYEVIGEKLSKENPAYAKSLQEAAANGEEIPKALIDGINKGMKDAEIDTVDISESVEKALNSLESDGYLEIEQDGKVKITADGGIDYDDVDQKTKDALDKLESEGVIEIDKEGNVTVTANVNTDSAKEKTESETDGALGGTQNVPRNAEVAITATTTGEEAAASSSYGETKTAVDTAYGKDLQEKPNVNITGVSMSGAGEAIASAWSKFKNWVKEKFSIGVDVTSDVRVNQRMGTTDHSKGGGKKRNANGAFVDRAIETIVGEAGPEYIIPVSPNRRQRGKYLWERAGRALGLFGNSGEEIYQNANGGLYGAGSSRIGDMLNSATSGREAEEAHRSNRNGTVKVDVGGIQISLTSSGNGVKEDITNNLDAISEQIAKAIEMAFQNMPLAVE